MSDVHNGEAATSEVNTTDAAQKDHIEHVVLLLMENHSFDQMLGCLDKVHEGLDGIQNASSKSNDDGKGHTFYPRETSERQMKLDPNHGHAAVLKQLQGDNGGFVQSFQRTTQKAASPRGKTSWATTRSIFCRRCTH